MVWAFRIGQDRDRPCCRTWGRLRWRACRRVLSLPLWCWCFWAFRLVWAEYAVCRWESRASGGHKARQRVYPAWEYCPVKDCRAEYRRQICRRRGALSCPSGVIGWEGTTSITLSVLFPAHPLFFEVLPKNKYSRNSLNFRSIFLLVFVIQLGFEPRTPTLKVLCSTGWATESGHNVSQLRVQI